MIFGRRGRERFLEAVTGLEAAVRERDGKAAQHAIQQMYGGFDEAADHELLAAGPRLAALLPEMPDGPRAMTAVAVGACVERGADATQCAGYVFDGLAGALGAAGEFCER